MRGFLETRRHDLADMIGKLAPTVWDPGMRSDLYGISSDAAGNVPMGKIIPRLQGILSKYQANEQAFAHSIGSPQAKPATTTAGAPTPAGGSVGNTTQEIPTAGSAAQPSTSLVQPPAQGAAPAPAAPPVAGIPPVEGAPAAQAAATLATPPVSSGAGPSRFNFPAPESLRSPEEARIMQMAGSPFGPPADALPYYQSVLTRESGMRRSQALINTLVASNEWDDKSPLYRQAILSDAMGVTAPNVPATALRLQLASPGVEGPQVPANAVSLDGQPVDRSPGHYYDIRKDMYTGDLFASPILGPMPKLLPNSNGTGELDRVNPYSGTNLGPVGGVVSQPFVNMHPFTSPTGHRFFGNALGATTPDVAGAIDPAFLPHQTSTTTTPSPSGQTITQRTQRIVSPGAPVQTPPLPGAPAPSSAPPSIRPFNPSDRTDAIVSAIGRDAANWKMATNAADKFRVTQRMAELGIDPNNITGSMRDRAMNANLILQHLNTIDKVLDQAQKDGDLGVVASRWNDFLANKVGSDPTKDQIFAKLSAEYGFLSTAASMAHGGLKAGSSPNMVEHWENTLEAKDAATMRSKLRVLKEWMKGYAGMAPSRTDVNSAPGGITPPVVGDKSTDPLGILGGR